MNKLDRENEQRGARWRVDEDAMRTKARTRGRELVNTLRGLSGDKSGTAMRATQETWRRARLAANNVQVTSSGVLDIMKLV